MYSNYIFVLLYSGLCLCLCRSDVTRTTSSSISCCLSYVETQTLASPKPSVDTKSDDLSNRNETQTQIYQSGV